LLAGARRGLSAVVAVLGAGVLFAPAADATLWGTPSYPTSLQASLVYDGVSPTGNIDMSWQPPSDAGSSPITGYVAELDYNGTTDQHLSPDTFSTSFTGVLLGGSHNVTVWAVNDQGAGSSAGRQIAQQYFPPSPAPYISGVWGAPAASPPTATILWHQVQDDGGLPVSYRLTSDGVQIAAPADVPVTVPTTVFGDPGAQHELRIYADNYAGTVSMNYTLVPAPPIVASSKTVLRGTASTVTARVAWSDTWGGPADGTLELVHEASGDPVPGTAVTEHVFEATWDSPIPRSDGTVQVPVPASLPSGRYRIYWSGDAWAGGGDIGPSRSTAVITVKPPTPTETLTLDERTTRYGTAFHLRVVRSYAGQLLANTLVRFSYLLPGQTTRHRFATALTDSHGVATASFTPDRNVSFVAGTPGDELWAAAHTATIATTTYNRVTVRLSTPEAGRATVTASVIPATRLTLQRSIDELHWHTIAAATGQHASWTVWQSASHPKYFRVVAAATNTTAVARSRVLTLARRS
jgi:hypothetical protein